MTFIRVTFISFIAMSGLSPSIASAAQCQIAPAECHDVELTKQGDICAIRTTGHDPFLVFHLSFADRNDRVLEMEYFAAEGIQGVQLFLGPPFTEKHQQRLPVIPAAETWTTYTAEISQALANRLLNRSMKLRLDLGNSPNNQFQIGKVQLRRRSDAERKANFEKRRETRSRQQAASKITQYLKREFPTRIETVEVSADAIVLTGRKLPKSSTGESIQIAEVPSWTKVTSDSSSLIADQKITLKSGAWTATIPRFDGTRDRLNSSWRLMSEGRFLSARRFPTKIQPQGNNYVSERPEASNQKGLGGLHFNGPVEELVDLGITAVTVNIKISDFLTDQPGPERERIELPQFPSSIQPDASLESPIYFNAGAWKRYDALLDFARQKRFVVSAILLIPRPKFEPAFTPLVHPDNDGGIFSMPNLTNPRSAWLYEHVLNRLAQRYSNPTKAPGGITNWIAHNEVDQHYIWTNMGKQPRPLATEAYYRSMRMIYNTARNYNPQARVFASLTHAWKVADDDQGTRLAPREILVALQRYSILEGDFQWGVAYHPYAQSLFAAKAWEDTKISKDYDTPMITMQNIEVLARFMMTSFMKDSARQPRPILLSEQGYHTESYSDEAQANQAGSLFYAMQKVKQIPIIESFHYHRWIDNRHEGGLKLGLRTLPTADQPYGKKKRAWYLFQALGTPREAEQSNGLPGPSDSRSLGE